MGGYITEGFYVLRAGERISVRTASQFHVRLVGTATAKVYLDQNRPETLVNVSTSTWLSLPPGSKSDASVEAIGGVVVVNDALGSGVPEPIHWW